MAIVAKAPENDGGNFKPAPSGLQQAVCVDVVDLGLVKREWQGQVSADHMARIAWQLKKRDPDNDNKPYLVVKRYKLSLHEKAALRKDLKSWRGKDFTEEELAGFDVEKVLGANCMLTIVHNKKGDTTYANVEGIAPLMEGLEKIKPDYEAYTRVKDRDNYVPPCMDADEVLGRKQSNAGGDGATQAVTASAPEPQPAGDFDYNADDELPF